MQRNAPRVERLHGFSGPVREEGTSRRGPRTRIPFRRRARTLPVTRGTFARPPFTGFYETPVCPTRLVYIFIYTAGRIDATDLHDEIYECLDRRDVG